jgi:hypothetical protein
MQTGWKGIGNRASRGPKAHRPPGISISPPALTLDSGELLGALLAIEG